MKKHTSYRRIGQTALQVSELGCGCASLGNLYQEVSEQAAQETLQVALQNQLNLFDTAPYYGFGLSERRVGDALRGVNKQAYVLSSKVGRLLTPDANINNAGLRHGFASPMPFEPHFDYSYDGIMRSFEDSLLRLGLAKIDILLVHDIGSYTHKDANAFHFSQLACSGYKALSELRATGAVQAIGLGVNESEVCEQAMEIGQFDCFLLAGRYTLLEQAPLHALFPKCAAHGASIILGGPYNSGILATGVSRQNSPYYNYAPAPESVIRKVAAIEQICRRYNLPLAAAALQFPLAHPLVSSVIPGVGSADRLRTTVELFNQSIPGAFWQEFQDAELIDPAAPVPSQKGEP